MKGHRPIRPEELKEADRLPSPTGVALAVLRLTDAEQTSATEVARVLHGDPALAGRILRVVNSAAYGLSRPIASVQDAVRRLGMRAVRNVALGFSLLSEFGSG